MTFPSDIFNIDDFGPIGTSDDTPRIQAAVNAARSLPQGGGTVYIPHRRDYKISDIDCTGWQYGKITAGMSWFYVCNQTVAAPAFDFTGSNGMEIKGIVPVGLQFQSGEAPPVKPLAGILLAGEYVAGTEVPNMATNRNTLWRCGGTGFFKSGALCNISNVSTSFFDCEFGNYDAWGPCLNISSNPDWAISSRYKALITGGSSSDLDFHGCRFHGPFITRAPSNWSIYMRDADNISFFGGNIGSSGSKAHYLFQGQNRRIMVANQQHYADNGSFGPPQYLFDCTGGDTAEIRVVGTPAPYGYSTALKNGSAANYPNFQLG